METADTQTHSVSATLTGGEIHPQSESREAPEGHVDSERVTSLRPLAALHLIELLICC